MKPDTLDAMEPNNRTARLAGWFYLGCALIAPFALIYVPTKLIVRGDPTATAHNLLASEGLFRWAIFDGLIATTLFVLAVLMLYRLLAPVSRALALAMVVLAVIPAPISLLEAIEGLGALNALHGTSLLAALDPAQRQVMAMFLMSLRGPGIAVSELFWGLWLLPLGALVIRSRFLPRWLGGLLLLNGVAYVAVSFTALVMPTQLDVVSQVATVPEFGELVFILWLLIRGIRILPGRATVAVPAAPAAA